MPSFLSDSDVATLKQMVQEFRAGRINAPIAKLPNQPYPVGRDIQSTGVYVCRPPSGGIPAMSGDRPGTAECDIYQMVPNPTTGTIELLPISDFVKTVYNITKRKIYRTAQTWEPIWRTQFGYWVAEGPETVLGETEESIAAGATGDVTVGYWSTATWTLTTDTGQTMRNGTDVTIASGKKVSGQWDHRGGQWIIGPLEC